MQCGIAALLRSCQLKQGGRTSRNGSHKHLHRRGGRRTKMAPAALASSLQLCQPRPKRHLLSKVNLINLPTCILQITSVSIGALLGVPSSVARDLLPTVHLLQSSERSAAPSNLQ